MKVVLSTRSMYPSLTKKVHSLFDDCKCITDRQILRLRTDYEYLYECFFNTDADYVISVDEDFFLLRPWVIDKIIEYMEENDVDIIGPPCTSLIDAKIIDAWFHIANINRIKKYKLSRAEMLKIRTQITRLYFPQYELTHYYYDTDKHEFFFLLMLEKGCEFRWFNKKFIDLEVLVARDVEFGLHTRRGRDYDKKEIKEHIDEVYDFVRRKYHETNLGNS